MLFQAVRISLLYRKPIVPYPSIGSDVAVAEKFKSFIIQTRYDLYAIVYQFTVLESRMSFTWINLSWPCEFATFQRVPIDFIGNFIKFSRVKTSSLDSLPASVLTNWLLPSLLIL